MANSRLPEIPPMDETALHAELRRLDGLGRPLPDLPPVDAGEMERQMAEAAATPPLPDLSHLPWEAKVRAAVAVVAWGATWDRSSDWWELRGSEKDVYGRRASIAIVYDDGAVEWGEPDPSDPLTWVVCRDPLTDPAAWGAVAVAEKIGFDWFEDATGLHCVAWPHHGAPDGVAALHYGQRPGDCVPLAVLAKHGVPVPQRETTEGAR